MPEPSKLILIWTTKRMEYEPPWDYHDDPRVHITQLRLVV